MQAYSYYSLKNYNHEKSFIITSYKQQLLGPGI